MPMMGMGQGGGEEDGPPMGPSAMAGNSPGMMGEPTQPAQDLGLAQMEIRDIQQKLLSLAQRFPQCAEEVRRVMPGIAAVLQRIISSPVQGEPIGPRSLA